MLILGVNRSVDAESARAALRRRRRRPLRRSVPRAGRQDPPAHAARREHAPHLARGGGDRARAAARRARRAPWRRWRPTSRRRARAASARCSISSMPATATSTARPPTWRSRTRASTAATSSTTSSTRCTPTRATSSSTPVTRTFWRSGAARAGGVATVPSFATRRGSRGGPTSGCCCRRPRRARATSGPAFRPAFSATRCARGCTAPPISTATGASATSRSPRSSCRANAAIPNERFRPEVYAQRRRGQRRSSSTCAAAPGRRLRLDAAAEATHYLFEDTLGVRLADFHNASGHALSVLLPSGGRGLYLRRTSDEQEFVIPTSPDVIDLADLSPQPPRLVSRGPADLRVQPDLLSAVRRPGGRRVPAPAAPVDVEVAAGDVAPMPRWRKAAHAAAFSVAVALGSRRSVSLASSAARSQQAQQPMTSQSDTAALNDRMNSRQRLRRDLGRSRRRRRADRRVAAVRTALARCIPSGAFDSTSGTDRPRRRLLIDASRISSSKSRRLIR